MDRGPRKNVRALKYEQFNELQRLVGLMEGTAEPKRDLLLTYRVPGNGNGSTLFNYDCLSDTHGPNTKINDLTYPSPQSFCP